MKVTPASIPDVLILELPRYSDERGFFMESYNHKIFQNHISKEFVQDNHSQSKRGVLRGLHFQDKQPQGKLVRVTRGEVFDVAVDIRQHSPTFGKHVAIYLSETDGRMIWIPEGFAHGFLVLSEVADLLYKTTDYYAPDHEQSILWSDPELAIQWPLERDPVVSKKDRLGKLLKESIASLIPNP